MNEFCFFLRAREKIYDACFGKQQNMTELIGLSATPTYHYEWIKHSTK